MYPEVLPNNNQKIFPLLAKFSAVTLAGGTALALQLGHRVSVDFDLFLSEKIPPGFLDKAKRVFAGLSVIPLVNNSRELTVSASEVKVTFLHYPFKRIEPTVRYKNIVMYSVLELAAMKAYTIGRRGTHKDYVDIYYVLRQGKITLADIIAKAQLKYDKEFNDRLFLEQLLYVEDIADEDITFLREEKNLVELKGYFKEKISGLKL